LREAPQTLLTPDVPLAVDAAVREHREVPAEILCRVVLAGDGLREDHPEGLGHQAAMSQLSHEHEGCFFVVGQVWPQRHRV